MFRLKGRPRDKPLTLHCSRLDILEDLLELEERDVLRRLLPGPVNVITSKGVGIRVFERPFIEAFCREVGEPIAATSANRSFFPSHPDVEGAYEDLGDAVSLYLDGGVSEYGIESTVLDLRGRPRILRPGAMPVERIEEIVGEVEVLPPPRGGRLGGKTGIFVHRGGRIPKLPRSITVGLAEGEVQFFEPAEFYLLLWEIVKDPSIRYVIFLEPEDLALKYRMLYFSKMEIRA